MTTEKFTEIASAMHAEGWRIVSLDIRGNELPRRQQTTRLLAPRVVDSEGRRLGILALDRGLVRVLGPWEARVIAPEEGES